MIFESAEFGVMIGGTGVDGGVGVGVVHAVSDKSKKRVIDPRTIFGVMAFSLK
jgi:hypothetical protein